MNESQQSQSTVPKDEVIDLRDIFRVLWAGKWLVGGVTFGVAVIAVIIALMLPNIYRAEALLAPNDREATGGLSALAAQYGGLASLTGLDLGGGQADKTALGLEVLKSRKFISDFVERHDLLVPLMAAEGWNQETGELVIASSSYDQDAGEWTRQVSPPRKAIPSSQEAYEKFIKLMSVSKSDKTGFVTLAVEHYSPDIAKQWVDWLIQDLNSTIMQQDVAEAEQAIEYLNEQIQSTSLADLQTVFFSLIEEQTKTVMLAKVTDEYLLKTLDPAVAPEIKSRPKRSLMVIFSTFFGFFVSVAIVLLLGTFRQSNDPK